MLGNAVYPTLAVMDVRAISRLESWRSPENLPWDEDGEGLPFLRDSTKAMVPAAYSPARLWTGAISIAIRVRTHARTHTLTHTHTHTHTH